jgi:hypothetical protein
MSLIIFFELLKIKKKKEKEKKKKKMSQVAIFKIHCFFSLLATKKQNAMDSNIQTLLYAALARSMSPFSKSNIVFLPAQNKNLT